MLQLVNHVVDVAPLGVPYTGVRSWAVLPVSSRVSWRSRAWSWTPSSWHATSGTAERRRNPAEIRSWAGRQKRRRRSVLSGWDRAARRRAQQRGRARTQ